MICPKCKKKMIKTYTGMALPTYPVQYPMQWWCGCGYTEDAEIEIEKTSKQIRQEKWEEINRVEENNGI